MVFIEKNYEERIVAFIDILGYKNLSRDEGNLRKLVNLLLEIKSNNSNINKKILNIEQGNQSFAIIPDIDSYSDHIIISSPLKSFDIIDSNDTDHLKFSVLFQTIAQWASKFQLFLLHEGIISRGAISYGKLYYDPKNKIFSGNCLNEAIENESNISIYPRVILSKSLLEYHKQLGYTGIPTHARTDFDGAHYVDYLWFMVNGKNKIEAFSALENIKNEISKNIKNSKLKISSKWKWLANYFDSAIEIWNINEVDKKIEKFNLQEFNIEQLIKTHKEKCT